MENSLLKNTGAFLQKEKKKKKVIKERNFVYSELKKICEFIMDMGFYYFISYELYEILEYSWSYTWNSLKG